jgi:hypothetical protein
MEWTWDNYPLRWTKELRKLHFGNTRRSRDERMQKTFIKENLGIDLFYFPEGKRSLRLNKRTVEMRQQRQITNREDFVDWTEDFDGFCQVGNNETYWNLKNITCSGGAQNRSIRPIIEMAECFAKLIKKNSFENKYFICITDGDYLVNFTEPRPACSRSQFEYAIDQVDPALRKYFYFGPLKSLRHWWKKIHD